MPQKDYSGHIVWFKVNVMLVQIDEKSVVINIARKQRFRPTNAVAHMLLYLIMRDRGEEIDFDGLKTHITNQYDMTGLNLTDELNAFLNKPNDYKLIGSSPGPGTDRTDPLGLYPVRSPLLTWATPDLEERSPPDTRATTIYTGGPIRITYRP